MSIVVRIIVLIELISTILLRNVDITLSFECPSRWFDCGNGKCISEVWLCDGDNDCGNFRDEHACENSVIRSYCLNDQFECKSDEHCIPEIWRCDGEKDCEDGTDEEQCENSHVKCNGFLCRNHHCVSKDWRCDGRRDCSDGSDEEHCPSDYLCGDSEFLCSSGTCLNISLVCDGNPDCDDGSDEGLRCGDPCDNMGCSQKCENTPSGPQCDCENGYILKKDNRTCLDFDECLEEGVCSHNCINTVGSYKCFCRDGYELINRTCKAKGAAPLLIFSTSQDIRGMRLGLDQYFLVRKAIYRASTIDVDPNNELIYWVEISNRSSIYSSKLDGSSFNIVLSNGLLVPEDIAVDYIAKNLYITDSGLRQVLACTISGTMCHILHHRKVEKPRSIILDLEKGFMYWSDWGEHSAGIYRSDMDGSKRIYLVFDQVVWPNGIAVDHTTNRLYWADAKLKCIEYITLDGRSRKVIWNSEVFHPYSLTVFEDTIYWTDSSRFSLESCNKFTGHNLTLLARENGRNIMGVHVYHPVLTSKVTNPCWSNDCSHMCLISPTKGFSCACPQGFQLSSDERSCKINETSALIFVNEGSSVFYIRPEAVGSETVTELPLLLHTSMITRVSYDAKSRILFVADANAPAIYAINLTSLHMQELVRNHITFPEDLSFDWASNNLYWIDSTKGTAEVISTKNLKRATLLKDLGKPVALAIFSARGHMFIATTGAQALVSMYDMNGKNKNVLHAVQGFPMSLALHPSKSILYWADPIAGTISYIDYLNSSHSKILKSRIEGVMSITSSEDYVYWTSRKRELNFVKGNSTYVLQLPGQEKGSVSRKVIYTVQPNIREKSRCLEDNGGCSYLCLTSSSGRTCICPSDMILAENGMTCVARRCEPNDFRCMNNGRCLPVDLRCDGTRDCDDGSDEVGCGNRCSGDDFQCRNGRCILKSWRCDHRNDCVDNSDEEDCPEAAACAKDQISCTDGDCISMLWRCDGEADCSDNSDEINCNETRCDPESQVRCDNGQCVPISWVCDGANDCFDETDEKNCSSKSKMCLQHEFTCESDGKCVDELLKCDGREDCNDGSDEKNCSGSDSHCKNGMYMCKDGRCIYHYEVCDGHNDCSEGEEESNCTQVTCESYEILCHSTKRCILRRWICDGYVDCADGSDENFCGGQEPPSSKPQTTASECEEFFCYSTRRCLPWSKVCNGHQDCEDLPDEGGLCFRSCSSENGGCSQICKKSPQGPKCSCFNGYRLLPDNKTCDDIDECLEPGTCSHFCNNTKGGFKCSCAEGYMLHRDHRSCKADGGPANLVYLLGDQIRGLDLISQTQRVYLSISNADMNGMDYDSSDVVFYWTEWYDGSINKYSPDTHRQDALVRFEAKPILVKCDWIEKNLYYTDRDSNIGVCSNDGRFCKILIQHETHIDSMDISPTTGQMFWSIWASQRFQNSGLILRAEMDGTNKVTIISEKLLAPTSITVDHVLKKIYWTDVKLNTIECANFDGSKRIQVIQYDMYYPYSMAVFEDYVYWSDWGTDSIIMCKKFSNEDCSKISEKNSKAMVLLLIHRVMQPQGTKRCLNSKCPQLCLPTSSNPVCVCGDGFIEKDGICEPEVSSVSPIPPVKCPEHYCLDDFPCVVEEGKFICKCSPSFTGNKCQIIVPVVPQTHDYSWYVFVMMIFLVLEIITFLWLLCTGKRMKLERMTKCVVFKFQNWEDSHESNPLIDASDESDNEELFLGQTRKCIIHLLRKGYTIAESEDCVFKKKRNKSKTQTINARFVNIFKKI